MGDNVTIPATGSGDATPKVATDQLAGGEHVQFVKLMDGTLDSSTKVGAINETGSSAVAALAVGGGTPHDSVDTGNPQKIGGRAQGSAPTAVSDGDRVNAWFGANGQLNVTLRDTSGAAVTTGTQYTEDGAIGANAGVGTLVVARRDDALSTLTPAADDAVGLRVGDKGALWVQVSDASGNQVTSFGSSQPSAGAETNVASSASDGTILASNASRKQATITNDSTSVLYLLLANAASSATVYSVKLASGAYYELPSPVYTGVIKGIWASVDGYARVTELS